MIEKGNHNSPVVTTPPATPSRDGVASMFDQIASRYEMVNSLLSLGVDHYWRKILSRTIQSKPTSHLDLATGTGQVLLQIAKDHKTIQHSVGLDPSSEMLKRAQKQAPQFSWIEGYAEKLPFTDESFDLATISFGIRNTTDPSLALREIKRTLKTGGELLVMEFSIPAHPLLKKPYLFYLGQVLPFLGGLVSGKKSAYRYLSETIQTFPHGEDFLQLLKEAGFSTVEVKRLTFGVVSIYKAIKLCQS